MRLLRDAEREAWSRREKRPFLICVLRASSVKTFQGSYHRSARSGFGHQITPGSRKVALFTAWRQKFDNHHSNRSFPILEADLGINGATITPLAAGSVLSVTSPEIVTRRENTGRLSKRLDGV
jgi:hypothetical protein